MSKKMFTFGLLIGDGSFQINHWRKKILQYRIVIKLKCTPANVSMLQILRDTFQIGSICFNKKLFVLWIINDKKHILNFIKFYIGEKQLLFLKQKVGIKILKMEYCIEKNIKYAEFQYMEENPELWKDKILVMPSNWHSIFNPKIYRGNRLIPCSNNQEQQQNADNVKLLSLSVSVSPGAVHTEADILDSSSDINNYLVQELLSSKHKKLLWEEWLCGFIEAEGCFSIRKTGKVSFSISQAEDFIIILAIKNYFDLPNNIQIKLLPSKKLLYVIETYNTTSLNKIDKYLKKMEEKNIGLMGEKKISWEKYKKHRSKCRV